MSDWNWYTKEHFDAENRLFRKFGVAWFETPFERAKMLLQREALLAHTAKAGEQCSVCGSDYEDGEKYHSHDGKAVADDFFPKQIQTIETLLRRIAELEAQITALKIGNEDRQNFVDQAREVAIRHKLTQIVEMGDGAIMLIVNPRSFADGGVAWKLRYANDLEPVRMTAASLIESYDYLISEAITQSEAVRRLRILREARRALLKEGEAR